MTSDLDIFRSASVLIRQHGAGAALAAAQRADALLERGEVGYALATSLTVETPLGDRSVEMTNRGNVPVRELAP